MNTNIINILTLIKRGVLRIFPTAASLWQAVKRQVSSKTSFVYALVIASALFLVACSTTRGVSTQLVHDTRVDTLYLSNMKYDSIYIYQERNVLPLPDSIHLPFNGEDGRGLYIKDVSIEYRYKLLRDTVRLVERDSIPYEVTVTATKEITRPLTWFDRLCRYSFFFLLGILLYLAYTKIHKFKEGCF